MQYVSTFKNRLIYVFRINDATHLGCVKIGEATAPDGFFQPNSKELNDAARKRINEYTNTAGVKYELLHTESTAFVEGGQIKSFNDKHVHEILKRSGIRQKDFDIDGKASEWFCCDLETAKKAIEAAKGGKHCLEGHQISTAKNPVLFRPEQKQAIEQTKRVLKKGNKMLWNAKMRMGKTLTSLEVVKQMAFRRTIIVTHRPVVDDGWFEDFGKIFFEKDTQWLYGSRNKGFGPVAELEKSNRNYIYFASMQDLRGSKRVGGDFDKNKDVFDTNWDLLIIDEAHEGTQTELGQKVLDVLTKENTKVLHLSGTPFNLMDEFDEETTFTWDYVMEQRAKAEWYRNHPGDPNPYEDLPKLNILTFDLGALEDEFADEDKAFNFREFFRTWTGRQEDDRLVMPSTAQIGDFVHESSVWNFLNIISSEKGQTLYPFSKQEYREFFHHTLWMVPGVKEGKALTEMLRKHPVFGNYKIVNVAGEEDDEASYNDALNEVKAAIGDQPENTYTITVSCGKLTTGVTVKPWTGVLYLSGSKNTSPQTYMQTIFRVQSPAVIGGKLKTECYVFDFAPDRTLKMVAETAMSAKAGQTTEDDKIILGDFINFCPIISCEGTAMKPYNVEQMMQQLKRVYVDKVVSSGFEDGHLYSAKLLNLSDIELESFANLRGIIGSTKANPQAKDITVNKQGFDKEDIEKIQKEEKKKHKKDISLEEAQKLLEQKEKRRQRDAAVSILRGISIRMPLLLFGAKMKDESQYISLDSFVEMVDDVSWAEFMPQGVSKDVFADYKKYYDEDIFAASGKQIRELARQADALPVLERIQRISEIFQSFRNPDKETVLTPWRVVNMHLSDTLGGQCFYDSSFENTLAQPRFVDKGIVTQRLFENAAVKILEINSKSGLYPLYMAYSVYCHRLRVAREMKSHNSLFSHLTIDEERQVWNNVLAENIFVICKTEMARQITQRTLAGFTNAKINTHVYDDLLNQITNKQTEFITRLTSGQIFKQIKNMKFDAIVGNPPYQEITAKKETDNGQKRSKSIFHYFQIVCDNIGRYISLIYPGGRWIHRSGKGLEDFGLKQINDSHLEKLIFYSNANDLFSEVGIADGISIVMKNISKDTNYFKYEFIKDGKRQVVEMPLPGEKLIPLNPSDLIIVEKITQKVKQYNLTYMDKSVLSQKLFSIESDFVEMNPSKVREYNDNEPFDKETEIKLFTNDKAGKAGRAKWYITKREVITTGKEYLDKWKVVVSSANAGGQKRSNQIQIIDNYSAFGRSRVALKTFETEREAQNFFAYAKSQFIRFCFLLTDESLTSLAKLVPDIENYSDNNNIIDFSRDVDEQLFNLFEIEEDQQRYIATVLAQKKE